MDSFIYALVLSPALSELLPKSGFAKTAENVGLAGSILFALFLVGWGLSFIWGPIADRFGRTRVLAATVLAYAVFTGAAALAENVWQLGLFRLLAGIGIGGEWALAGTYVAEAWPEDRRKMGAGYLQTGYYFGFFLAAALNYTVGARFGWRAMFLCGLSPVIVSVLITAKVKEPERWKHRIGESKRTGSLALIFGAKYRRKNHRQCGFTHRGHRGFVGWRGLRAHGDHDPGKKGRHVVGASLKDGIYRNGDSFSRNNLRLPGGPPIGGTSRTKEDSGRLFCGHVSLHIVEFWLGVLFAEWAGTVHRVFIFFGFFWRQFCAVQLVASRAIRNVSSRNGLRIRNFRWPLYRGRRQFFNRRDGPARWHDRQTRRIYGNCVWAGTFNHSVRARDSRSDLTGLKVLWLSCRGLRNLIAGISGIESCIWRSAFQWRARTCSRQDLGRRVENARTGAFCGWPAIVTAGSYKKQT